MSKRHDGKLVSLWVPCREAWNDFSRLAKEHGSNPSRELIRFLEGYVEGKYGRYDEALGVYIYKSEDQQGPYIYKKRKPEPPVPDSYIYKEQEQVKAEPNGYIYKEQEQSTREKEVIYIRPTRPPASRWTVIETLGKLYGKRLEEDISEERLKGIYDILSSEGKRMPPEVKAYFSSSGGDGYV